MMDTGTVLAGFDAEHGTVFGAASLLGASASLPAGDAGSGSVRRSGETRAPRP